MKYWRFRVSGLESRPLPIKQGTPSQPRRDSGLGLSHFQYEGLELPSCPLPHSAADQSARERGKERERTSRRESARDTERARARAREGEKQRESEQERANETERGREKERGVPWLTMHSPGWKTCVRGQASGYRV